MTRRASMRSSNRPTSGEINPLDSAITLGSKETCARPQPKCLTRAGIKTGTVLYPPPKATKSVTHRLATIIQPRRSVASCNLPQADLTFRADITALTWNRQCVLGHAFGE